MAKNCNTGANSGTSNFTSNFTNNFTTMGGMGIFGRAFPLGGLCFNPCGGNNPCNSCCCNNADNNNDNSNNCNCDCGIDEDSGELVLTITADRLPDGRDTCGNDTRRWRISTCTGSDCTAATVYLATLKENYDSCSGDGVKITFKQIFTTSDTDGESSGNDTGTTETA